MDRAIWGTFLAVGVASLLAGLVAGTFVLGLARLRDYSWAPPRLLAARLLGLPYEDVGRWPPVVAHYALAVLALVVVGLTFLGLSILTSVFGPAGGSLLVQGPVITVGLLAVVGVAAWLAMAYRWLPAAADVLDCPLVTVRRQVGVVGVAYAVVVALVYPLLLFLSLMVVFFR